MVTRRITETGYRAIRRSVNATSMKAPLTGRAGGANIRADGRHPMIINSKLRIALTVALTAGLLAVAAVILGPPPPEALYASSAAL